MSEVSETFEAIGAVVEENTNDEGTDIVNVFVTLIEAFKADPDTTIETWELLRLSIRNSAAIMDNLIDEELARLKAQE